MASSSPVVFGLVGLGGYAAGCCAELENLSEGPDAPLKLVAVCEPDQVKHAEKIASLKAKGVKVFADYDAFLKEPFEAVWLPLPIHLHRPFTEKAVAAGKAVLVEKPLAGSIDDADAMIAARDRAGKLVAIGFQDIYMPSTLAVKKRLLSGEIGKIKRARVLASWPRPDNYYSRNAWAGAFKREGTWVMDSPTSNAMAHYINLPLFLMGPTLETSAVPVEVEAELYRSRPIENFDTMSMRLKLDTGATLLVHYTHTSMELINPEPFIECERGSVLRGHDTVIWRRPQGDQAFPRVDESRTGMVVRFAKAVRGQADPDRGLATLEVGRAHMLAVCGASEASEIHDVPADQIAAAEYHELPHKRIAGIEDAMRQAHGSWQMLHETGAVKWSRPAGRFDLRGYKTFAGPKGAAVAV